MIDTDWEDDEDSMLARCLASTRVLPDGVNAALASFLVWRLSRAAWNSNELWDALVLLIIAIRLRHGRFSEAQLGAFASWLLGEEGRLRQSSGLHFAPGRPVPFSLMHGFWQPLIDELQRAGEAMTDGVARENVLLCAMLLEPES